MSMESTPGMLGYGKPVAGFSLTSATLWQKSQWTPKALASVALLGSVS